MNQPLPKIQRDRESNEPYIVVNLPVRIRRSDNSLMMCEHIGEITEAETNKVYDFDRGIGAGTSFRITENKNDENSPYEPFVVNVHQAILDAIGYLECFDGVERLPRPKKAD